MASSVPVELQGTQSVFVKTRLNTFCQKDDNTWNNAHLTCDKISKFYHTGQSNARRSLLIASVERSNSICVQSSAVAYKTLLRQSFVKENRTRCQTRLRQRQFETCAVSFSHSIELSLAAILSELGNNR